MIVIESRIVDRVYNRPVSRSIPVQVNDSFSLLVYLVGYLVLIHHTDKRFSWPSCTVWPILSSAQRQQQQQTGSHYQKKYYVVGSRCRKSRLIIVNIYRRQLMADVNISLCRPCCPAVYPRQEKKTPVQYSTTQTHRDRRKCHAAQTTRRTRTRTYDTYRTN